MKIPTDSAENDGVALDGVGHEFGRRPEVSGLPMADADIALMFSFANGNS